MEKKNHLFKAEIKEMLDLVVNSLYSKKEIFLRELISNASDAIDRAKYLGLTQKELVADNPTWRIDIVADKDSKTLMISDNGAGMDVIAATQVVEYSDQQILVRDTDKGRRLMSRVEDLRALLQAYRTGLIK